MGNSTAAFLLGTRVVRRHATNRTNSQALLLSAGASVSDKLELLGSAAIDRHAPVPARVCSNAKAYTADAKYDIPEGQGGETRHDENKIRKNAQGDPQIYIYMWHVLSMYVLGVYSPYIYIIYRKMNPEHARKYAKRRLKGREQHVRKTQRRPGAETRHTRVYTPINVEIQLSRCQTAPRNHNKPTTPSSPTCHKLRRHYRYYHTYSTAKR